MSKTGTACVLLTLLAAGCARSDRTSDDSTHRYLTKVTLQTDWYAQAEHGGFYQALAKGFYRDVGLDVKIDQGGPSVPVGLKLATGVVQFAYGRGDEAIVEVARDIPVVVIGAAMQHDPEALLLHDESPVKSFKDLHGRSVMTVPGANWVTFVQMKYHIKFNIIPLNFGMAQFMADPQFIQQCFVTNEPYYVEKNGGHPRTILLSETGFDPYRVIVGNADYVARHPDIARAFVQASIRGWIDYLSADPAPANRQIEALNLQMTPDFIAYARDKMKEYRLVAGDAAKDESIGCLSRRRIQEQIDALQQLGALDRPLQVADVVPAGFLTQE
jgi:NitT/TauT family transport system substrate-binding protein